jgi:hypothetical protein
VFGNTPIVKKISDGPSTEAQLETCWNGGFTLWTWSDVEKSQISFDHQ